MRIVEQMIEEMKERGNCCDKEAGTVGDAPKGYSSEESDVEDILAG